MSNLEPILVSPERYFMLLGQLGNIQTKIDQLRRLLKTEGQDVFLPYLQEVEIELSYLKVYLPYPNDERSP